MLAGPIKLCLTGPEPIGCLVCSRGEVGAECLGPGIVVLCHCVGSASLDAPPDAFVFHPESQIALAVYHEPPVGGCAKWRAVPR